MPSLLCFHILSVQCAFCFPVLIRLFFSPCPSHRLSQGCLFCLPLGWLPFLCHTLLSSHPTAPMLTIISPLLLLFSTQILCHCGPSTSCPTIIRPPHGRPDSVYVCVFSLSAPVSLLIVRVGVSFFPVSTSLAWEMLCLLFLLSRVLPYLCVHIESPPHT